MIQIKPINFLGKEATQIDIRVELVPNKETSTAFYNLRDSEGGYLYDGIVEIPSDIHAEWGVEDDIVINYILAGLKLEEA